MAFVSMSGLDMSFLKEPPKKKRGRPRKHPINEKPVKSFPDCRADFGFPCLMTDIKPFVSPIDGAEISSRSALKAHERRHGVKQAGDFKKGEIVESENKRVAKSKALAEPGSSKWL